MSHRAGRIEIARMDDDPRAVGRPLMSDHNLSARLWATGALVMVPFVSATPLGWWLPLHMALAGAASQAIVGGQLMFSATLGLAPGLERRWATAQLALLNVGAGVVIWGRLAGLPWLLATGATTFVVGIGWAALEVHRSWRRSPNRRFAVTGTFYRLAAVSVLVGAAIGGALGAGVFDDASYLTHRNIHMIMNVYGWAGLTIVGTAVTLLPTIMHVRAPTGYDLRAIPWVMFAGLIGYATTASLSRNVLAGAALAVYLAGLVLFGRYVFALVRTQRRRKMPTAAFHLIAALIWMVVSIVGASIATSIDDAVAARAFVVVGGAAGTIFQALLGAWAFLVPSLRAPVPERRRRELVGMELGGRFQVLAYNLGLLIVLAGLLTDSGYGITGMVLAWGAAAWAVTKTWTVPILGRLPWAARRSAEWWAAPEERGARR